jgi:hypothetical protein
VTFDAYYNPPDEEAKREEFECDRPGCKGDGRYEYERRGYRTIAYGIPNVCDDFTLIGSDTGSDCGMCHHDKECH